MAWGRNPHSDNARGEQWGGTAAGSSCFNPVYFKPQGKSCFGKPRVLPIPGFKQHMEKKVVPLLRQYTAQMDNLMESEM